MEITLREINESIGETGVKPGTIGEVGMSGEPHEPCQLGELKALVAAARTQRETGLSPTVHPNIGFALGCDPAEHFFSPAIAAVTKR